jgi:hypothetical protein
MFVRPPNSHSCVQVTVYIKRRNCSGIVGKEELIVDSQFTPLELKRLQRISLKS